MRAPAIPRSAPAFLASLALHAAVLALALSRGADPGQADGRTGMAVEILTPEQASERTGTETAAPPPEERKTDPKSAEERDRAPKPSRAETTARSTPPAGPRLIGSANSPYALPGAEGATDARTDAAAGSPRPEEAQAVAVGPRARRRADAKDGRGVAHHRDGEDPKAAATGTAVATPGARRLASTGIASLQGQALPPSLRDALVELLQRQVGRCYVAPGNASRGIVLPVIAMRLNQDGSLGADPRISRSGRSPADAEIAQAAPCAVRRCAPYSTPARFAPYYEDWRDISAEFEFLPD